MSEALTLWEVLLIKWLESLIARFQTKDPCPSGGDHDWVLVTLDEEETSVYICLKCQEFDFE